MIALLAASALAGGRVVPRPRRMSLADEAAVDLDVRFLGGIAGLSQGSYEAVDDQTLRAVGNEVLGGPTFGAGARLWLGRHAAIDADARYLVWTDEVPDYQPDVHQQTDGRRRAYHQTTLSIGLTVATGRRPEPLPEHP